MSKQSFPAEVVPNGRSGILIRIPFDPDATWGRKTVHHVSAKIGPCDARGPLAKGDDGFELRLGPAWVRDSRVRPGDKVNVTLWPEGPQRDDLAPDFAAALEAAPKAAEFFDGLAQFYRKAYLRWIDATKRRPDERVRRIKETVKLLRAGKKDRPPS
jgi:hypothetical protein